MVEFRGKSPYFSVIIPVWNRADMINRAIDSCLSQSYGDFEIIVVDDGSTDGTAEQVERYGDERVILLRHERNKGTCPARNTGISKARGDWLVMLDSDFELVPGALENLAQRTAAAADDIGNVASSCQWDTGEVTPMPDVPGRPIGYEEYLAWTDTLVISEWFNCHRRQVFETVMYSSGRAYVASFHRNVARRWRIDVSREVAIIVHTDATNRLTAAPPDLAMQLLLRNAKDCAADADMILRDHGLAMRRWAPRQYRTRLNYAAMYHFLAGHRAAGVPRSVRAITIAPTSAKVWATLLLGLIGPRALAWAKTHPLRAVNRRRSSQMSNMPREHP